jgi:hypothetical protein
LLILETRFRAKVLQAIIQGVEGKEEPMRAFAHALLFALLPALGAQGIPASHGPLRNYSLLEDFNRENKAQMVISAKIPTEAPYDVISQEELTDISEKNGRDLFAFWREFHKRYPNSGGYIKLSAVGFNAD